MNFRYNSDIIVVLLALLFSGVINGQEKELVKYTTDFRFNDGIFLNFDQVRANNPIAKARLLTSSDYNDKDFFKKLFENDNIYFYDNMGLRQEVSKSQIWGFARNGVLYIQVQEAFHRVTYLGSIAHFVADVTTYDTRYYNPGGYYSPYGSPYGYYDPYSSYYSPYYSPYRQQQTARSELRQFVIEFETGKTYDYEPSNVEVLLIKDPELYDEFVRLSRKKKKQSMFIFIRRFNERNPLYLPKDS